MTGQFRRNFLAAVIVFFRVKNGAVGNVFALSRLSRTWCKVLPMQLCYERLQFSVRPNPKFPNSHENLDSFVPGSNHGRSFDIYLNNGCWQYWIKFVRGNCPYSRNFRYVSQMSKDWKTVSLDSD